MIPLSSISQCSRGNIVDEIRASIASGNGIVPLIGSGMSAASGIPAGEDYQAYLFYCLARVFGGDGREESQELDRWDPSKLCWPNYSELPKYHNLQRTMLSWSRRMQRQVQDARRRSLASDLPTLHDSEAKWQACGAVADWRASLHLLSRISLDDSLTKVRLKDPDSRVVDSFFVSLTEGRRPNTAHILLAHLADVLRIKVMLTTNFDNLIELAFQRLDMPVATFDVHYQAGLPDARLVRARRSVVKLHGGRYGLRADFSLDTHPRHDDVDSFLSYLSRYDGGGPKAQHQRNILVMGISPEGRRTISFLCDALVKFGPHFRVFWICHSKNDAARVQSAFDDQLGALAKEKDEVDKEELLAHRAQLRVTSVPDLGLFLLELYQTLFFCLPPAGVPFNMVWPVPPPTIAGTNAARSHATSNELSRLHREAEKLEKTIQRCVETSGEECTNRSCALVVVTGARGVPLVATEAFYSLAGSLHCVWFEIEQSFDAADFVMLVLESIAREVGVMPMPPFPPDSHGIARDGVPEALEMRLESLVAHASRRFVLFINARQATSSRPRHNGSLTGQPSMDVVVAWLAKAPNVTVVLLSGKPGPEATSTNVEIGKTVELQEPAGIAKELINTLKELGPENGLRLAKFTLGLALFRHPCYLSALQCWALQPGPFLVDADNDKIRFGKAKDELLPVLRKCGVVRDDEGQSVYIYPELRTCLVKYLRRFAGVSAVDHAETHHGIADWYVKLYRASGDVHAALESIAHRLKCIRLAARIRTKGTVGRGRMVTLCASAINEIRLTIENIGPTILSSAHLGTLLHMFDELDEDAQACAKRLGSARSLADSRGMLELCRVRLLDLKAQHFAQIGRPRDESGQKRRSERFKSTAELARDPRETRFNEAMHGRQYEDAAEMAQDLFDELKIGRSIEPMARDHARRWARSVTCLREKLPIAVRMARRYQLLRLYQAEVLRLNDDAEAVPGPREAPLLREGERLYVFATELMRYADSLQFVQEEMGLLRANTGILLSWMNRHHDAHRQYSEAYGYFDSLSGPGAPLRFATVDLRRVETFLCQLQRQEKGHDLARFGLIYDAIAGVERAFYKVADISATPRWYAWLREVEMSVCCEIASLTEAQKGAHQMFSRCRDRGTLGAWFCQSLSEGCYVAGKDPLRLARYLQLADRFVNSGEGVELEKRDRKEIDCRRCWVCGELQKLLKEGRFVSVRSDPLLTGGAGWGTCLGDASRWTTGRARRDGRRWRRELAECRAARGFASS